MGWRLLFGCLVPDTDSLILLLIILIPIRFLFSAFV